MNTIVDFFSRIIEDIKERAKNPFNEMNTTPFAGAFAFFFIVCHWQLFFSILEFDSWETREVKIGVIKNYFENKKWWSDVVWPPIQYSFISILTFYAFNNLSLIVTILFTKWLKPLILFVFDRNKLVTRRDMEAMEKVNRAVRNNNQRLQNTLEATEKLVEEHEQAKLAALNDLEKHNIADKEFKVLYSWYGTDESNAEVTQIVKTQIANSGSISVNPIAFGLKEADIEAKKLFILYSFDKKIESITAKQEEIVEFRNNKLTVTETHASKGLQAKLQDKGDILKGYWRNEWSRDNRHGKEDLFIINLDYHFLDGSRIFKIEELKFSQDNVIELLKVGVGADDKRRLRNVLKIENSNLLIGKEWDEGPGGDRVPYDIRYTRFSQ